MTDDYSSSKADPHLLQHPPRMPHLAPTRFQLVLRQPPVQALCQPPVQLCVSLLCRLCVSLCAGSASASCAGSASAPVRVLRLLVLLRVWCLSDHCLVVRISPSGIRFTR